eukprot:11630037-Ditylum_brightwellii.AAC.1
MSDMTTLDGTAIHPKLLRAIGDPLNNQLKTVEWMQQRKPNKQAWVKVTKTLLATVMYESGKLKQPLGVWLKTYKKWTAYFDKKKQIVYAYDNQ